MSSLPPPFCLSARPHPGLSPAEPPLGPIHCPRKTVCPPWSDLPATYSTPTPIPLPETPKNRDRGVLTAARETGALRFCPAPSQDPQTAIHTRHFGVLGWRIGTPAWGWGPKSWEGPAPQKQKWGKPTCPPSLGAAGKCCRRRGVDWGAVLMPRATGPGSGGQRGGASLATCPPPSFSAATQDEGPALPALAGAPPPGPGLTAPAPRPRPAPRPPAGSPAPGCAEPPGG